MHPVIQKVERASWREASIYQIYPPSFKDTNGDGIGDIQGIISELDYIKSVGVDMVWLSPVLASPQIDMGYDISDYKNIYPPYGTMADHDALIKGLHDRGLKYILDLVVNHTSDQHPWFKESKSSKTSRYRDWYFWRPARQDPETGKRMPPNNWESFFSTSAWTWDDTTQEYYLHLWSSGQPDLNWENPEVVNAVHDIVRFWLDRGVDGFRMDVINYISKTHGLPDAKIKKPGFLQKPTEHCACGPRLHEYLRGIGSILQEYGAFSVGEMPDADPEEVLKAVGQDRGELAMAFHFDIDGLDLGANHRFDPAVFQPTALKNVVNKWQTFMASNAGWNALHMENHDESRTVSRYACDSPAMRTISAKMLANHLAFQSGTLFIYQGQELAMVNLPREWGMEKYKDIECLNHWGLVQRYCHDDVKKQKMYRERYRQVGRDNARTPMQWNSESPHAGFMSIGSKQVEPWMSIHPDFGTWNVSSMLADPQSSLHHWRRVLKFRKQHSNIFVYGGFEMLNIDIDEDVIAYIRTDNTAGGSLTGPTEALVVTSFSATDIWWTIPPKAITILLDASPDSRKPNINMKGLVTALDNYEGVNELMVKDGLAAIRLRPYETLIAMRQGRPKHACTQCKIQKRKCHSQGQTSSCIRCLRLNLECNPSSVDELSSVFNKTSIDNQGQIRLLPSQEMCNSLVDIYFDLIHDKDHTLFHRPSFIRAQREGRAEMMHVFAMMALAARFASDQWRGDSELCERRKDWSSHSKRLFNDRTEPVSLSAIQACMLLCCISASEGETEMESLYGAQAIRMVQLRRLQTSLSTHKLQREMEIRVWWNVWMWDCWESAGSCIKQQLTIDPDFPIPMEEHAFEQLDPGSDHLGLIIQRDEVKSRQHGLWAQMIPFTQVVAPINEIHELTVQNRISDAELFDKIERIADKLETWKLNLPSTMHVTPTNLASYSSTGLGRTLVALHTGYHHFSQLLYYQFLHRSTSTAAEQSPQVAEYARRCRSHAADLSNLLSRANSTPGCECRWLMVGHLLAVSSSIHLHTLLFDDDEIQIRNVKKMLRLNFEMMMELRQFWPGIDLAISRLQVFHRTCQQSMDTAFDMDYWMLHFLQRFAKPIGDRYATILPEMDHHATGLLEIHGSIGDSQGQAFDYRPWLDLS
ncbi:alpha-glucosidase (maltase) [Fusarium sp. NRRL 52700]|nr:alpha-glucosidase (maltase) [Fusarium sp. NRRL 52700]